ENISKKLKRSGLITETGDPSRWQFAAPLVRIVIGHKLFTMPVSYTRSSGNFEEFLCLTIERMRPSVFTNSLSHGNHRNAHLLERAWQMEWYQAATTTVPANATISPDVGQVFGSVGYHGNRFCGVVINTPPCHGGDREFDSCQDRH